MILIISLNICLVLILPLLLKTRKIKEIFYQATINKKNKVTLQNTYKNVNLNYLKIKIRKQVASYHQIL